MECVVLKKDNCVKIQNDINDVFDWNEGYELIGPVQIVQSREQGTIYVATLVRKDS